MEYSTAVEKHARRETAAERLARHSRDIVVSLTRLSILTLALTPILVFAFLGADLPIRTLDRLFGFEAAMQPSRWLTQGALVMALAPLAAILITRRFGGDEASRAITAAWTLAAVAAFLEISYLAPTLESADFPPVRFTVAFVVSAMAAQYIAVNAYDVARGGGKWWRAPLYGALAGFVASALLYFPITYFGAGVPWLHWMVGDVAIKAAIAFAFLPVYAFMRRPLRPRGGFGGQ